MGRLGSLDWSRAAIRGQCEHVTTVESQSPHTGDLEFKELPCRFVGLCLRPRYSYEGGELHVDGIFVCCTMHNEVARRSEVQFGRSLMRFEEKLP